MICTADYLRSRASTKSRGSSGMHPSSKFKYPGQTWDWTRENQWAHIELCTKQLSFRNLWRRRMRTRTTNSFCTHENGEQRFFWQDLYLPSVHRTNRNSHVCPTRLASIEMTELQPQILKCQIGNFKLLTSSAVVAWKWKILRRVTKWVIKAP